jgi:hypothetical protein
MATPHHPTCGIRGAPGCSVEGAPADELVAVGLRDGRHGARGGHDADKSSEETTDAELAGTELSRLVLVRVRCHLTAGRA